MLISSYPVTSHLTRHSLTPSSQTAPSYFSQYFLCQITQARESGADPTTAIRTLYIDRDPVTFHDISLHLQGYHVAPRDGTHFVRLFADAQFYSLPRLISQLYDESIFMSIGHREFQIPRDLFSDPGNSPNFFSLGFAVFFSSPTDLFPGLDREGLIRPPSILPPSVPGRSADTFAELLHLLRGYPLHIRDDEHRATLLRDCRYFNFKGLEQRLIPHALTFNQARRRDEIVLRLEDILKSGISVSGAAGSSSTQPGADPAAQHAWVNYARPFVDDRPAELVLEIGGENTRLHFLPQTDPTTTTTTTRVEFFRDARARFTKLLEVVASKLGLASTTQPLGLLMAAGGAAAQPASPGTTPLTGGDDWVRCAVGPDASITLDGRPYTRHHHHEEDDEDAATTTTAAAAAVGPSSSSSSSAGPAGTDSPTGMSGLSLHPPRKRRRLDGGGPAGPDGLGAQGGYWILRTGQWRLRLRGARGAQGGRGGVECVLVAVKIDAVSGEHARNEARGFLKG